MSDLVGEATAAASVTVRTQKVGDVPVNVVDFGGRGAPMVLVHGLGGSVEGWLAAGPRLAQGGRVVALDLAGFGRTPLADDADASVESNRALLDRFLMETFDEPVFLVGNSMGGMISMMQAATNPATVCGLVLVDPAIPHPPDIESDPVVNAVFSTYATPGSGEEFLEKNARTLTPERSVDQRLELQCVDPARVPTVVRDAMIERTRERASLPWVTRAFLEAARSLMALNADPDRYHEMIRSISKPTLLVHGARDRLIPLGAADAIAALQPRWRYVVIPDIGHIPHVEATGEFVRAVLAWLGDNRAEDDLVASTRRG